MAITAAQVNELRQKTGAGMMDCKKALTEAEGNFEKAIEILRKKGAAVAAKRAERTAKEGMVLTKISDDKQTGVIVEVNCETDFVANSEDFTKFAKNVLEAVSSSKPANVDDLLEKNLSIKDQFDELLGKVGEKIQISRLSIDEAPNGEVIDYVHLGSKLGVLVKFDNIGDKKDEFFNLGKDIAMQVAAMKPICVYREEVQKDLIEKEIEIYKEISRKEGKPEQILDKIAQGKLNKFYQENCLSEQAFIKDNTKTVTDLIKEFNSKHGTDVKINHFRRFHLGDEKK
ncbi:MAG TPA: translation elongation factor Ts [Ignavibacteriaceae bacterium]|nr:translation elongation factor Ts [Ignavibacteriaceae bacterium]